MPRQLSEARLPCAYGLLRADLVAGTDRPLAAYPMEADGADEGCSPDGAWSGLGCGRPEVRRAQGR